MPTATTIHHSAGQNIAVTGAF